MNNVINIDPVAKTVHFCSTVGMRITVFPVPEINTGGERQVSNPRLKQVKTAEMVRFISVISVTFTPF